MCYGFLRNGFLTKPLTGIDIEKSFHWKGIQIRIVEQIAEGVEVAVIQSVFWSIDIVFPYKTNFTSGINYPAQVKINGKGIETGIVVILT